MIEIETPAGVNNVMFRSDIGNRMSSLTKGRHDPPFRSMTGTVQGATLFVSDVLSYEAHVAVLGLIASGVDVWEAPLLAATGSAGAFAGDLAAFEKWQRRVKFTGHALLSIKLTDGCDWIIWQKRRRRKHSLVSAYFGWSNGQPTSLDAIDLRQMVGVVPTTDTPMFRVIDGGKSVH